VRIKQQNQNHSIDFGKQGLICPWEQKILDVFLRDKSLYDLYLIHLSRNQGSHKMKNTTNLKQTFVKWWEMLDLLADPLWNREQIVIIWCLEAWRHFLEGAKNWFEIWTDHKNLEYSI